MSLLLQESERVKTVSSTPGRCAGSYFFSTGRILPTIALSLDVGGGDRLGNGGLARFKGFDGWQA